MHFAVMEQVIQNAALLGNGSLLILLSLQIENVKKIMCLYNPIQLYLLHTK